MEPFDYSILEQDEEEPPRGPRGDAVAFMEHCMYLGGRSPLVNDGDAIRRAVELIAEAFWPDLQDQGSSPWLASPTVQAYTSAHSIDPPLRAQ